MNALIRSILLVLVALSFLLGVDSGTAAANETPVVQKDRKKSKKIRKQDKDQKEEGEADEDGEPKVMATKTTPKRMRMVTPT